MRRGLSAVSADAAPVIPANPRIRTMAKVRFKSIWIPPSYRSVVFHPLGILPQTYHTDEIKVNQQSKDFSSFKAELIFDQSAVVNIFTMSL
jgi:hypothetical protein